MTLSRARAPGLWRRGSPPPGSPGWARKPRKHGSREVHGCSVATENRIGLAQLPRWATLIVGMLDLLKLLGGLLVGVVQIACGSRSRDGISPPAAGCAAAIRAGEAQAARIAAAQPAAGGE